MMMLIPPLLVYALFMTYVNRKNVLMIKRKNRKIDSLKSMHDVTTEQLKQANEYIKNLKEPKVLNCAYNFKVKHSDFQGMYGKDEIIIQLVTVDEYERPQTIDEEGYESSMEIAKIQLLDTLKGSTIVKKFDYDNEPKNIDLVINMPLSISENLS